MEKLTLDAQGDTGYDTSNYVKNWKQAGEDFENLLGIPDFKKKYGGDQTINVYKGGIHDATLKSVDARFAYTIFQSLRKNKVDLLEVAQSNSKMEEKNPYVWKSHIVSRILLNEDLAMSPVQRGTRRQDNTFWRSNRSSAVFVKRTGTPFNGFLFSNAPAGAYDNYLHMNNGSLPGPIAGAGNVLSIYAQQTFKKYLVQAVQHVKQFTNDEENIDLLDQLASSGSLLSLPLLVCDSIMMGILEAANTKINQKQTQFSTVGSLAPQGANVLNPANEAVLANLRNDLTPFLAQGEIFLPDKLKADMASAMSELGSHEGAYDVSFRQDLEESLGIQKYNLVRALTKATTTLYSGIAQAVNVINSTYQVEPEAAVQKEVYFSHLNWYPDRVKEFKTYLGSSLVNDNCPIVVVKATRPAASIPLRIESFVVDFNKTSGTFISVKPKSAALDSEVHGYIQTRIPESITDPAAVKDAYVIDFGDIKDNAGSTYRGELGKELWLQILRTCYDASDRSAPFKTGVLFAGLSPLFWDESTIGCEIRVCDDVELANAVELTCSTNDGSASSIRYKPNLAAGLHFDRFETPTGPGELRRVSPDSDLVKDRSKNILKGYNFRLISDIRDEILEQLYSPDMTHSGMADIAKGRITTLLNNIQNGYWTLNRPELDNGNLLACYNPWIISKVGGKDAVRRRFDKANTGNIPALQQKALNEYGGTK